jgi:hypothetical protein
MQGCDEVFLTRLSLSIGVDPGIEIARTAQENQRLVERARRLVILSSDAPEWAAAIERPVLARAVPILCG